jgi:uncharacterized membrane protein
MNFINIIINFIIGLLFFIVGILNILKILNDTNIPNKNYYYAIVSCVFNLIY